VKDSNGMTKAELTAEIQRLRALIADAPSSEVLHDLEVHQEELEATTRELLGAKSELERARDRYAE
jgi:hypothetical protein